MRVQLWSYNYDPEPTGIGPVSRAWALEMQDRGHAVQVIAAHPHYPSPAWGRRLRPYRELRDGIPVLRLPLWVGRATGTERVRQELSFAAALTSALPFIPRPDVAVAVSPSFPALAPIMLHARTRRYPWVLWLQDILPEGAEETGLLRSRTLLRSARHFESQAYRSASAVAVISETFRTNLIGKGVPPEKLRLIYNPATHPVGDLVNRFGGPLRVLSMGNIGRSQGLERVVRVLEQSGTLRDLGAKLIIVGHGVASEEVRAAICSEAVEMRGLVDESALRTELEHATIGLVSQRPDLREFNVPSKLMNFMACGLPVIAVARPESEVARIVHESGGGWVIPAEDPEQMAQTLVNLASNRAEIARRADAALAHAQREFTLATFGDRFESLLLSLFSSGDRATDPSDHERIAA